MKFGVADYGMNVWDGVQVSNSDGTPLSGS